MLTFDVEGHIGIVEGHAQEGPAAVEYEADAFVRRFGNGNALFFGPLFKGLEDVGPVGLNVAVTGDLQAILHPFRRLAEGFDEVA